MCSGGARWVSNQRRHANACRLNQVRTRTAVLNIRATFCVPRLPAVGAAVHTDDNEDAVVLNGRCSITRGLMLVRAVRRRLLPPPCLNSVLQLNIYIDFWCIRRLWRWEQCELQLCAGSRERAHEVLAIALLDSAVSRQPNNCFFKRHLLSSAPFFSATSHNSADPKLSARVQNSPIQLHGREVCTSKTTPLSYSTIEPPGRGKKINSGMSLPDSEIHVSW